MTGVILAGGAATRFFGQNKALLKVGGVSIIDAQLALFKKLFDETIIVTNDCYSFLEYDALIVNDIIPGKGPLGGIYTAMHYMKSDNCFVAACDMPFLNEALISRMISDIGKAWIYTIEPTELLSAGKTKRKGAQHQPLHSIYSKKCSKTIKNMLVNNELKISFLFDELRAKRMSVYEAKQFDAELKSFVNINTQEELDRINESE